MEPQLGILTAGNSGGGRTFGISAQLRILDRNQFRRVLQSDFNLNTTLSFSWRNNNPIILKRFVIINYGKLGVFWKRKAEHLQR